jgi:hypothetical protein
MLTRQESWNGPRCTLGMVAAALNRPFRSWLWSLFFSSANRASIFFLCRRVLATSGVFANSRARCRAGSLESCGSRRHALQGERQVEKNKVPDDLKGFALIRNSCNSERAPKVAHFDNGDDCPALTADLRLYWPCEKPGRGKHAFRH